MKDAQKKINLLKTIAEDMGKGAEFFGKQGAAIQAIALLVKTIIEEEGE